MMIPAPRRTAPVRDSQAAGRIIHCADYGGSYSGSFVPMLAGVAKATRDRGYDTTICFSEIARNRPWLDELSDLAEIRFITSSGSRAALRQLKPIVDASKGSPTILHTHFGSFDVAAALLGLQHRSTAVLWHAHSATNRRIRLRSMTYGSVFGRIVDAVLCVSPAIYQEALDRRYPRGKLRLVPNAIDLTRFAPITHDERVAARRKLGLSPSAPVILHFGWDWVRKGGDLFLAAVDALGCDGIDAQALCVGGGEPARATVDRLGLGGRARVMDSQEDVRMVYAAADIFVSSSRAEGMPYSMLEALACGLLIVATDLPVQRDLLDLLPGARVVGPEPNGIFAGLREVLALTPEDRSEHAVAARDRIAASYALDPWCHRLVDLYEEALNGVCQSWLTSSNQRPQ